jgi:hypothetical protein
LLLLVVASMTDAAARDVPHGNYMGSGRACYGMLTITSRRITWVTPFSECLTSPYAIVDRRDQPNDLRITYELARPGAKCRYQTLVLTHDWHAGADIGWNVVGYPSLADASENRRDHALGCYLYRR